METEPALFTSLGDISSWCGGEEYPRSRKSTSQDISFSDVEIISAVQLAYIRNEGTLKSITHSDVYMELGIVRGSRAWEERIKIISPRRLSQILYRFGFVSINKNHGFRARYTKVQTDRGVC